MPPKNVPITVPISVDRVNLSRLPACVNKELEVKLEELAFEGEDVFVDEAKSRSDQGLRRNIKHIELENEEERSLRIGKMLEVLVAAWIIGISRSF